MRSEGVSVWFACKLCKSYFLNADDFAYHKRKSHVQEFRNTKFIVFEEKTTPPALPPENWVSFLSPKEETQIHKIISLSSTPTLTDVDHSNEKIQNNQNQGIIVIDSDSNDVDKKRNHGSDDAGEVSSNTFELDYILNSDTDDEKSLVVKKNDLLQCIIAPTSTDSDLTSENGGKRWTSVTKSRLKSKTNSLKSSNKKIRNVSSKKALLQTVIQSPNNPYVYMERLNLRTVQNVSSHSNSTANSQERDTLNKHPDSTNANRVNKPKVTDADQQEFNRAYPAISYPPVTTFENCKFCSEHFNSAEKLKFHQEICCLKRQFESIVCVPCQLIFSSSDELDAHNQTFHSTFISTPTLETETTNCPRTELTNEVEITPKKEIQSDFLQSVICNTSRETYFPLSKSHGNYVDVNKTDFNPEMDHDSASNADYFNGISHPTTEVNLNYGKLMEDVKIEYLPGENEGSELPGVDHVPFETESCNPAVHLQLEADEPGIDLACNDEVRPKIAPTMSSLLPIERSKRTRKLNNLKKSLGYICQFEEVCGRSIWLNKIRWREHVRDHFPELKCQVPGCTRKGPFSVSLWTHVLYHSRKDAGHELRMPECLVCKSVLCKLNGMEHLMLEHAADLDNRKKRVYYCRNYCKKKTRTRKTRVPTGIHVYRILDGETRKEAVSRIQRELARSKHSSVNSVRSGIE